MRLRPKAEIEARTVFFRDNTLTEEESKNELESGDKENFVYAVQNAVDVGQVLAVCEGACTLGLACLPTLHHSILSRPPTPCF